MHISCITKIIVLFTTCVPSPSKNMRIYCTVHILCNLKIDLCEIWSWFLSYNNAFNRSFCKSQMHFATCTTCTYCMMYIVHCTVVHIYPLLAWTTPTLYTVNISVKKGELDLQCLEMWPGKAADASSNPIVALAAGLTIIIFYL